MIKMQIFLVKSIDFNTLKCYNNNRRSKVPDFNYFKKLKEKTALELTKSPENWKEFLQSASRLYKYNFSDQLLIYAQNPNATACANFQLWNEKMNRRIKRGEKSIRLVDEASGKMKYVFDISQTYANERSKTPFLWQNNKDTEPTIIEVLRKKYDLPDDNIINLLFLVSKIETKLYKADYLTELSLSSQGSFLEELDEFNQSVIFTEILEKSIYYSLLFRCGFEPDSYIEDFTNIFNFNSIETLSVLGASVSEISENILREIEIAVKSNEIQKIKVERSMHDEQNQENIGSGHSERNNQEWDSSRSVSGGHEILSRVDKGKRDNLQTGRTDIFVSSTIGVAGYESRHREIRSTEAGISEKPQERLSDTTHDSGQTESLSGGTQPSSSRTGKSDDGKNVEERPLTGGLFGTGSAQERSDGFSRGNSTQRNDLQVNDNETAEESATSAVLFFEPVVIVNWSEHPELTDGMEMPLSVANELFRKLDLKQNTERNNPDLQVGWYKKTSFSIKSVINGEEHTYEGRQDLGDGEGSLLNHIKNHFGGLSTDNGMHSHYKSLGDEKYQEFLSDTDFALNTLIPYYEAHIELANFKDMAEKSNINGFVDSYVQSSLKLLNTSSNIQNAISDIHSNRKASFKDDGLEVSQDKKAVIADDIILGVLQHDEKLNVSKTEILHFFLENDDTVKTD